jgi:hypothetical protein
MREDATGALVYEADVRVEPVKLAELTTAIGTESAAITARLVPWFGATVGGEQRLVSALGMDLSKALLAGHRYDWARPFEEGEDINVRVVVDQVYSKGENQFAIIRSEFRDSLGALVHSQMTTFIERGAQ